MILAFRNAVLVRSADATVTGGLKVAGDFLYEGVGRKDTIVSLVGNNGNDKRMYSTLVALFDFAAEVAGSRRSLLV